MEIRIQSIHFDADVKLLDFTKKKLQKLQTFHDRVQDADVYLKFENNSAQVRDKIVDISINIPGTTLHASETSKSFEEAVDSAVDALTRQLQKHKEKLKI